MIMYALEILEILSDKYSLKIVQSLSVDPSTIPQLSRKLDIPMAACYRRVNTLLNEGLIQEDGVNPRTRRKSVIYSTNIFKLDISFGSGKLFIITYFKDNTRLGKVIDLRSEPYEEQIIQEDLIHTMKRDPGGVTISRENPLL